MGDRSVGEGAYVAAWALFILCATVAGFVATVVAGLIVRFVCALLDATPESVVAASGIVGFLLTLMVSYLILRVVVATLIVQRSTRTPL